MRLAEGGDSGYLFESCETTTPERSHDFSSIVDHFMTVYILILAVLRSFHHPSFYELHMYTYNYISRLTAYM
jgi:hypothetical protein